MDERHRNDTELEREAQSARDNGTTPESQLNGNHAFPPPKNSPDSSLTTSFEGESGAAPMKPNQAANNASSPEAARTTLETAIIMGSLGISVFLAALDNTIITTALPTISEHFHSNAGYTWIGSAYLLANAASTPSWGKFSDIWGRKPILLAAAAIFFIGSLLAATAVNIGMLITARAIQGTGGGGLIVLVNICISDLFIPITGTVIILLFFFLHLHNPRTPAWEGLKAVDWAGSLLIVGGTLMLLLGLEFGGVAFPWNSPKVICLIVFGVVVAVLFVLNEWKFARYPVMPLRLFKHTSNIASLGVCFCHGFVFIAVSYYLPLYFQAVLGATPLLSGLYLLPFALSLSVVSAGTGIWIKKTGKYLIAILFGSIIFPLGIGLLIDLDVDKTWVKIIIFQIIAGIGVGPNFQSPLIALQTMVKPTDIATATATFGFIRNLSTSISVVIGGVVFQNEMERRHPSLVTSLGVGTANALKGGSAGSSVSLVNQLPPPQQVIARQAFFESLRTMWIMYVVFAGMGLLFSFFVGNQILSKEHQVTRTGLTEQEKARKDHVDEEKAVGGTTGISNEEV
ncbi:hypothetical protein V501_06373 [Pseudogymnoascus sp. VKM F-4519 (FW-2642)]|nr:hypothetical protein V501_06373 [Pseudogymnoascus sp. VKM F-4519 (FW-2642)]